MLRILFVWGFSGLWTIFPLFGWNRYVPEGNMTACGTDYITKDWVSRSYILAYSVACYYAPFFLIVYSYWFIVQVCSRYIGFMYCAGSQWRLFHRLSLLTKRTCENKPRKWMLLACDQQRTRIPVLNANWPKLLSWPFHCGSWHGKWGPLVRFKNQKKIQKLN